MKRWKAILGVLLVFLLGAAAGAIVMHRVDRVRTEAMWSGKGSATVDMIVSRFTRSLDLDAAQQQRVRAIVTETHREVVELRKPAQREVEAAIERSRARVREILHPDQQAKFDRLQAERRERHERHRD